MQNDKCGSVYETVYERRGGILIDLLDSAGELVIRLSPVVILHRDHEYGLNFGGAGMLDGIGRRIVLFEFVQRSSKEVLRGRAEAREMTACSRRTRARTSIMPSALSVEHCRTKQYE